MPPDKIFYDSTIFIDCLSRIPGDYLVEIIKFRLIFILNSCYLQILRYFVKFILELFINLCII